MVGSTQPKDGWPRDKAAELVKLLLERLEFVRRYKWPIKRVWVAGDYAAQQRGNVRDLVFLLETGNKINREIEFFKTLKGDTELNSVTLVSISCPTQWYDGVSTEERFEGKKKLLWQSRSLRRRRR